ncbi:FAD/NAD(P)-binding domain-containing protein [Terfezia boudieri ATCC MYA-4762]|uniref:FAD/NAD(P)-binding domain-containing protein n=1 Tax=Terfezia boudieri ATCC MYA-4762 TaxID=1051890 RepID=A0A3N4MDI6_9PEZI|nr:FAD/NAD(P)-binding domain-containing protein [Terfezia boudieri ATCC MYA-4762]
MAQSRNSEIPPKKSVAVIGAGPAGLATAKALLEAGLDVQVFEVRNEVGGLWAVSEQSSALTCQPKMRVNLSRWTCSFSDLNWKWKHIHNVRKMQDHGYDSLPVFPQARDVHLYLQDYAATYIPAEKISLGMRVTHVSQLADTEAEAPKKWRVRWETVADTQVERPLGSKSRVFDYIAIASGFFSSPHVPAISGLEKFKDTRGQVFHSSNCRDFLYAQRGEKKQRKIVVVGGSISSVEVVSALLFNREYVGGMEGEVVHLFPRPFWVLPRYLRTPNSSLNDSPSFLPLDFVLYDGYRRRNAQKPTTEAAAVTQEEKNIQANKFMRSKAGNGDQSSLSPHLKIGAEEMRLPPYVSISDSYANFVRSGNVKLERGYLASIKQDPKTGQWNCLEVSSRADVSETSPKEISRTLIQGVDVIIFATGYKPTTSFPPFLPQQILEELAYKPDDNFLPVLLFDHILHPALISYSSNAHSTDETAHVHAGFIGIYKGPHFGVLESQARYLAGLFQGSIKPPPKPELEERIAGFKAMREGRKSGRLELRGQWSWGDYLGNMEELEERMLEGKAPEPDQAQRGIDKAVNAAKETSWGGNFAPVIPAYYAPYAGRECQEGIAALLEVAEQAIKEARFAAKAVFRSLQGSWKVTRTLNSRLIDTPSGTFVGIAKFLPRRSTFQIKVTGGEETELNCVLKRVTLVDEIEGSGQENGSQEWSDDITEYIYSEHGTFTLSTPPYFSFPAMRKYIYRYHPGTDSISAWFVKPQSGLVPSTTPPGPEEEMEGEVDYLFHEIEFLTPNGAHGERIAKGKEHLCAQDLYKTKYKFKFVGGEDDPHDGGAELSQFNIRYVVQGPKKDYSSEGMFQRA